MDYIEMIMLILATVIGFLVGVLVGFVIEREATDEDDLLDDVPEDEAKW